MLLHVVVGIIVTVRGRSCMIGKDGGRLQRSPFIFLGDAEGIFQEQCCLMWTVHSGQGELSPKLVASTLLAKEHVAVVAYCWNVKPLLA